MAQYGAMRKYLVAPKGASAYENANRQERDANATFYRPSMLKSMLSNEPNVFPREVEKAVDELCGAASSNSFSDGMLKELDLTLRLAYVSRPSQSVLIRETLSAVFYEATSGGVGDIFDMLRERRRETDLAIEKHQNAEEERRKLQAEVTRLSTERDELLGRVGKAEAAAATAEKRLATEEQSHHQSVQLYRGTLERVAKERDDHHQTAQKQRLQLGIKDQEISKLTDNVTRLLEELSTAENTMASQRLQLEDLCATRDTLRGGLDQLTEDRDVSRQKLQEVDYARQKAVQAHQEAARLHLEHVTACGPRILEYIERVDQARGDYVSAKTRLEQVEATRNREREACMDLVKVYSNQLASSARQISHIRRERDTYRLMLRAEITRAIRKKSKSRQHMKEVSLLADGVARRYRQVSTAHQRAQSRVQKLELDVQEKTNALVEMNDAMGEKAKESKIRGEEVEKKRVELETVIRQLQSTVQENERALAECRRDLGAAKEALKKKTDDCEEAQKRYLNLLAIAQKIRG